MFNYLENKKNKILSKKEGFTLVELVIVVAIIGILVVMAMASYGRSTEDAKLARVKNDVRVIAGAAQLYTVDTGSKPNFGDITATAKGTCNTLMTTGKAVDGSTVGPWLNSCPVPPWSGGKYSISIDGNNIVTVTYSDGSGHTVKSTGQAS